MRNLLLLLVTALSLSPAAFAGGERIGNGGDVLVCGMQSEMLDVFQARQRALPINLGEGASYEEKVDAALARLALVSPVRAAMYRNWWVTFLAETEFLRGQDLVDIPDTGAISIPTGCHLQQIAVQRSRAEMLPGDSRYSISDELWQRLDETNKASLILHELAYREAIEAGNRVISNKIRYFNGYLMSERILTADPQDLVAAADFPFFERDGEVVDVTFDVNTTIYKKFRARGGQPVVQAEFRGTPLRCSVYGHYWLDNRDYWQVYGCTTEKLRVEATLEGLPIEFVADLTAPFLFTRDNITRARLAEDALHLGENCKAGRTIEIPSNETNYPLCSAH